MQRFTRGDTVRIDIPDTEDPDFERLHGREGVVVALLEDDAGQETSDERDNVLYRVELAEGGRVDVRWRMYAHCSAQSPGRICVTHTYIDNPPIMTQ